MTVKDITGGNPKTNMVFCSHLFNTCPGLIPTEEEKYAAAELIDDDVEGSREERSFRMWFNSQGLEGVYLNNLYSDLSDGMALLKVLDKVQPGCVDWKKVEKKPDNKFKKMHNCSQAVNIGRDTLHFSLVGISGGDIHDGNKKLILAFMWQLIRLNTLQMLGDLTEAKLIEWGNSHVRQEEHIKSFKDSSLSNCKFLFQLL